jgi:hypothetical protein
METVSLADGGRYGDCDTFNRLTKLPERADSPQQWAMSPRRATDVRLGDGGGAARPLRVVRHRTRTRTADALSYVRGYTCINDVSARRAQVEDGQWTRAGCECSPRVLAGAEEDADHDGTLAGAVLPVVRDAWLLHNGVSLA